MVFIKKYTVICLIFLLLVSLASSKIVFSEEPIKVIFDGQEVELSTPILIQEEVILVPVRCIFEALGAQVKWNSFNQSISVTKDGINIWLQINNQKAKIGEKEFLLDIPIKLVNNNAVMPLNFISEAFSVKIEVDKKINIIRICDTTYGFPLTAKAHILVEPKSGLILLDHNSHKELKIANVSKIMNLLLIFEALENNQISLDDLVTVSEQSANMQGCQLFLEANEQISVETLVKSIIIMGANDSAMAMAEYIEGSEKEFLVLMNKKAQELGMKNTHFINITGIDEDGQYSSAYDIAIMTRELITEHSEILEFSKIKEEKIIRKPTQSREISFYLCNNNKLLKAYESTTGLITGYTAKAEYCLVGTTQREGFQLIAVTLGAPSSQTRFEETIAVLNFGFGNYDILKDIN